MPDPALQGAGKRLLAIGIVALVIGIAGFNLTTPSTKAGAGSLAVLDIGLDLALVGAIAWALGGIRSTVAPDQVNAGLRRTGFLLVVVGVLGAIAGTIAGLITQPVSTTVIGVQPISSTALWVAIIGAIIVALSHRRWASATHPSSATR